MAQAKPMPFKQMEQMIADWTPHVLSFSEVKKASNDIEGSIIHTPLCEAKLSKYMDYNLYLKCENLQYTGSCAERGVRNAFHNDASLKGGVIVPSYCNTALGAAYHGSSLGIPVTAVLPNRTPPATAQRCSELGADVILCGDNLDDAITYANKLAKDNTLQPVLTSDHPLMMAGLGSVGVEILMQLPDVEAVLVPVRSGALLAAVLVACKKLKCSTLVYGVESAKTPKMMKALQFGKPVSIPVKPSLAEGLNISTAGYNAFATIKGRLDRMLVVEEAWLARALVSVAERERLVADPAGVSAVAAVMQGLVPELRGKKAVCIITGGNIDAGRLARLIHRGLTASSRLLRFTIPVADQRDGLVELAKLISDQNAVIKSIVTEQMWMHSDVGYTWANVVVETANDIHAVNLKDRLREFFPLVKFTVASF